MIELFVVTTRNTILFLCLKLEYIFTHIHFLSTFSLLLLVVSLGTMDMLRRGW